jgi:hypothetical protein
MKLEMSAYGFHKVASEVHSRPTASLALCAASQTPIIQSLRRDPNNAGWLNRLLQLGHHQLLQGWVMKCQYKPSMLDRVIGFEASIITPFSMISKDVNSALRRRLGL